MTYQGDAPRDTDVASQPHRENRDTLGWTKGPEFMNTTMARSY